MFRSTAHSLRVWWTDFSADILGADLPPSVYDEECDGADRRGLCVADDPRQGRREPWVAAEARPMAAAASAVSYHRDHPHRRVLVSRHMRRDGQVSQRPQLCLCPVRSSRPAPQIDSLTAASQLF